MGRITEERMGRKESFSHKNQGKDKDCLTDFFWSLENSKQFKENCFTDFAQAVLNATIKNPIIIIIAVIYLLLERWVLANMAKFHILNPALLLLVLNDVNLNMSLESDLSGYENLPPV